MVVAGVIPATSDTTALVASLQRFIEARGASVNGFVLQRRGVSRATRPGGAIAARTAVALHASTYLGTGKTEELARLCTAEKIDVVVFINSLTIAQRTRIEQLTGATVIPIPKDFAVPSDPEDSAGAG